MDTNHICSPETPIFNNSEFNEKIELYHQAGLSSKKFNFISEIKHQAHDLGDRHLAKRFMNKHQRSHNTEKTVLTTHHRGVFNQYDHDTLIFDEDPLQNIISIKSIEFTDLQKLLGLNINQEALEIFERLYLKYLKMDNGTVKEAKKIKIDVSTIEKKVLEEKLSFNLVDFLNADYVHKVNDKINYCMHNELPNKKVAIMSATCNEHIYKKLYGERIQTVDLSNTEITGNIIQHTEKSYSRNSLRDSIDRINEQLNGKPTITFKDFKKDISGAVGKMHFGNVRGYNKLKGRDINVVGTPHKNNSLYLLVAKAIGIDLTEVDINFSYRTIKHKGFKFKFNCYENDDLRKIQLHFIESELKQAVGRARLLREDATVHVYSNLPLEQAEFTTN